MYLRLEHQAAAIATDYCDEAELRARFRIGALSRIHSNCNLNEDLNETMLSPLGSNRTAGMFLNMLMDWKEDQPCSEDAMRALAKALEDAIALDVGPGQDDILYGRAGLLWSVQYLRACRGSFVTGNSETRNLDDIFAMSKELVKKIVESGKQATDPFADHQNPNLDDLPSLPLMWMWHNKYYLGAARSMLWLAQACWCPSWDEMIYLAARIILCEGILRKGAGLCHGVSGNIWALLLAYESFNESQSSMQDVWDAYVERTGSDEPMPEVARDGDQFLSVALAMLPYTTKAPPLAKQPFAANMSFRMPDHPWSLFEGLSGTVCLWAEVASIVRTKLSLLRHELSDDEECMTFDLLGFPGLTVPLQEVKTDTISNLGS
ncbi:hypothetical protein KEM54_003789 [Ascosphaera aggregata]|nr:hypothetical protein KEM54_003789 [Ascosphaera aggregata]